MHHCRRRYSPRRKISGRVDEVEARFSLDFLFLKGELVYRATVRQTTSLNRSITTRLPRAFIALFILNKSVLIKKNFPAERKNLGKKNCPEKNYPSAYRDKRKRAFFIFFPFSSCFFCTCQELNRKS